MISGLLDALICAGILVSSSVPAHSGRDALDRPNVVIFFLDDSGYGDYTHTGNPTISTPQISRLAREGVQFTQFYVTSPACSASRYSLMTGRYPARSGLGSWVIGPGSARHLHPDEFTLAEGLRDRGYATALFGKWHLGTPNERNGFSPDALPLAHGFERWVGTNVSHDYANSLLIRSDPQGKAPVPGYRILGEKLRTNHTVARTLTGRYTEAAVQFIEENHEHPFFACITHNMPHLGLEVGEAFEGTSRRGLLGDVMAEVDDSVGRVVAALEAHDIARNTLVLFSSDNGPWLRFLETAQHPDYGEARLHVGYAHPFRDGKGSTWEGGHRVPGLFWWPGVIEPRVEMDPASTLDVLPTVFGLCGVDLPDDRSLDGRDIRPLLSSKLAPTDPAVPPFELIYSYSDNRASALRIGPWKMHVRLGSQLGTNYGFSASRESPLLFQVEHDLGERIDRAAEEAERVRGMQQRLTALEKALAREGTYWD